jgi:hypothetical protein
MSAGEQNLLAVSGHFHVRPWAVFHVRRHLTADEGARLVFGTRRDAFTGIAPIDFDKTFRRRPTGLMDRLHRSDLPTVPESPSVIDR